VRDERWFSGEQINTLVASPLSCANDGDDEADEDWEEDDAKRRKRGTKTKKRRKSRFGQLPTITAGDGWSSYVSISKHRLRRRVLIFRGIERY
jgi:hypothetical protein